MSKPGAVSETFGCNTFSLTEMQKRLPRPIYEAIQATIASRDRSGSAAARQPPTGFSTR